MPRVRLNFVISGGGGGPSGFYVFHHLVRGVPDDPLSFLPQIVLRPALPTRERLGLFTFDSLFIRLMYRIGGRLGGLCVAPEMLVYVTITLGNLSAADVIMMMMMMMSSVFVRRASLWSRQMFLHELLHDWDNGADHAADHYIHRCFFRVVLHGILHSEDKRKHFDTFMNLFIRYYCILNQMY